MNLEPIPLFCGGVFLVGLHTLQLRSWDYARRNRPTDDWGRLIHETLDDERIIFHNVMNQVNRLDPKTGDYPYRNTHFPFIPRNLNDFQMLLGLQFSRFGRKGIIYAVTNNTEQEACEFLEATGFKKVAVTNKYGREANPRLDASCITWIGDYYNDVRQHTQKHSERWATYSDICAFLKIEQ